MTGQALILFDGVCNLCSASVQWIIRHDPQAKFRFASLQGNYRKGLELLRNMELPDSLVLIRDEKVYVKSGAVLRIAGMLGFPWNLAVAGLIVPAFIRDFIYDRVAASRYSWFGKKDACWLPDPELKARFMDD